MGKKPRNFQIVFGSEVADCEAGKNAGRGLLRSNGRPAKSNRYKY